MDLICSLTGNVAMDGMSCSSSSLLVLSHGRVVGDTRIYASLPSIQGPVVRWLPILALLGRGRTLRIEENAPTGLGFMIEWPELISISTDSAVMISLPSMLPLRRGGGGGEWIGLLALIGGGEE